MAAAVAPFMLRAWREDTTKVTAATMIAKEMDQGDCMLLGLVVVKCMRKAKEIMVVTSSVLMVNLND